MILAGRDFHRAVAETLIDVVATPAPGPDRSRHPDVVNFVARQLESLPAHLRLGVLSAAAVVAASVVAVHRRRFEQLPAVTRTAIVRRWMTSRLPTTQLYVRMMRQLTLFASYEISNEAA